MSPDKERSKDVVVPRDAVVLWCGSTCRSNEFGSCGRFPLFQMTCSRQGLDRGNPRNAGEGQLPLACSRCARRDVRRGGWCLRHRGDRPASASDTLSYLIKTFLHEDRRVSYTAPAATTGPSHPSNSLRLDMPVLTHLPLRWARKGGAMMSSSRPIMNKRKMRPRELNSLICTWLSTIPNPIGLGIARRI